MNIIKTLSHHIWGANQKSLLTIYKSLILSKIKYGSQIYNSGKPNLLKILDPIHNEGIRLQLEPSGQAQLKAFSITPEKFSNNCKETKTH